MIASARNLKKVRSIRHAFECCRGLSLQVVAVMMALTFGHRVAFAQVRGLYTPGAMATNSGNLPEPGFFYGYWFLNYSFDQVNDGNGALPVDVDYATYSFTNLVGYVTKPGWKKASFAVYVGIPFANASLSAGPEDRPLGGGAGIADLYIQLGPGWEWKRAAVNFGYSLIPSTGRYTPGASNNIGSGYGASSIYAGETLYLTKNQGTQLSAWQYYEFHTTQDGSDTRPGQTFSLDWSLTQLLPLSTKKEIYLQAGVVGYEQFQTTDNAGPDVDPLTAGLHYRVNAVGGAANVVFLNRNVSLGMKYFSEFGNKYTVQGYSWQFSGGVTF